MVGREGAYGPGAQTAPAVSTWQAIRQSKAERLATKHGRKRRQQTRGHARRYAPAEPPPTSTRLPPPPSRHLHNEEHMWETRAAHRHA
jgi:hypothetical protein